MRPSLQPDAGAVVVVVVEDPADREDLQLQAGTTHTSSSSSTADTRTADHPRLTDLPARAALPHLHRTDSSSRN